MKLRKYTSRLSILGLLGFVLYEGPGLALSTKAGVPYFRIGAADTEIYEAASDIFYIRFNRDRLQTCDRMTPYERSRLTSEAGLDLVQFVEDSTRALHGAKTPEDQLRVIASRFDHKTWSSAWDDGTSVLPRDPRAREFLRLQADLGHASLVLNRYNRIIENGKRQEYAALSGFNWRPDARKEIERDPMRVLVRGFMPHVCVGTDQAQYGCVRGETLYRMHTLISPRIACRFQEKREQYAAVFWIRMVNKPSGELEARIIEVEANGQELVRNTYEELMQRKKLRTLQPDVTETLVIAGLDPFRAPTMWRNWMREPQPRQPASYRPVSR